MSAVAQVVGTTQQSWINRATHFARQRFAGRRGLILLAVLVLGVGAALNWGWLVAVGIAPLLVAFAPCALMCAAGVCMSKAAGKSCSKSDQGTQTGSSAMMPSASRGEP